MNHEVPFVNNKDVSDNDDSSDAPFHLTPFCKKSKLQCDKEYCESAVEVLEQIKDKFKKWSNNSMKALILRLALQSWSRRKIAKEFAVLNFRLKKRKISWLSMKF